MKDPTPDSLDRQLAALPREITPPAQVWRRIERQIGRTPRRARPAAWAAAAALVCAATALTWVALLGRAPAPATPMTAATPAHPPGATPPGATPQAATPPGAEPADARYLAARSAIEQRVSERLVLLDPASRAQVVASIAVIRTARANLVRSLAEAPGNPVLEDLLASTWHQEFDLYTDLLHTSQPLLKSNPS